MAPSRSGKKMGLLGLGGLLLAFLLLFGLFSCSFTQVKGDDEEKLFRETLLLVQEVKKFGRTLGIEPTEALGQSAREKPAHSMVWLWLQRFGTIALRTPVDIRLGISFSAAKEELPHVAGHSEGNVRIAQDLSLSTGPSPSGRPSPPFRGGPAA